MDTASLTSASGQFIYLTQEERKARRKATQQKYYAANRETLNEQNKLRFARYMLDPERQHQTNRARIVANLNSRCIKRPHKKTLEKYSLMFDPASGRYL